MSSQGPLELLLRPTRSLTVVLVIIVLTGQLTDVVALLVLWLLYR